MTGRRPRIVVVGSINMDLVVTGGPIPRPGETVTAKTLTEIPGGKGANQAVAAARSGGDVTFIGAVGDDSYGPTLRDNLAGEGIDVDAVRVSSSEGTGVALITVDPSGENAIAIVPGANGGVSVDDVRRSADVIRSADVLLVQLEVPLRTVLEAMSIARDADTRIVLDPAPAPTGDWPAELLHVDVLCPNESEAEALTGIAVTNRASASNAAAELRRRGVTNVAVTMGASGTLLSTAGGDVHVEAFPINPIDTTAAGDSFAGTLAVRWASGVTLRDAVPAANAAGALAASRAGAQPSIPTATEIQRLVGR